MRLEPGVVELVQVVYKAWVAAGVLLLVQQLRQAEGVSGGSGMVKQNVEPVPGPSDSTQIRPLCSSIIRLARAKPMPVPEHF